MQLTLLGILALGGAILLIYATLHRRPTDAERANRRRSDDGKIIYLFNDRAGESEGSSDGDSEAQEAADGEFTDVEFSEVKAEESNEDREK
ncbi:MAG: hypothetical protein LBK57_02400 [Clostridiales Family XIII bacterium]|jgi:hypothetical protein|nr:hypothetical protein [Clostridiales Family XIII bacterium]